jgi:hypothetical protein
MAHFAKVNSSNIVEKVLVVSNDIATSEQAGKDFLNQTFKTNDNWMQCSYNTRGGIYYIENAEGQLIPGPDQSKAFRKNFPGINSIWFPEYNGFAPSKPYPSWILDPESCIWDAPVERPLTDDPCDWDEENQTWVVVNS